MSNCTVEFVSKNVSDLLNIAEKSLLNAPQQAFEEVLAKNPASNIHRFESGDHLIVEFQEALAPEPDAADRLLEEAGDRI